MRACILLLSTINYQVVSSNSQYIFRRFSIRYILDRWRWHLLIDFFYLNSLCSSVMKALDTLDLMVRGSIPGYISFKFFPLERIHNVVLPWALGFWFLRYVKLKDKARQYVDNASEVLPGHYSPTWGLERIHRAPP